MMSEIKELKSQNYDKTMGISALNKSHLKNKFICIPAPKRQINDKQGKNDLT